MKKTLNVTWLGEQRYLGVSESGHQLLIDNSPTKIGVSPMEALLGALGFLGSVAEGSIADWSGIFLRDHFGVSEGFAPLSLTAFSTMMLLSRLFGDRLKMKHGARKLVFTGALTAYITPAVLGGAKVLMLETLLYQRMNVANDIVSAAVISARPSMSRMMWAARSRATRACLRISLGISSAL